MPVRDQLPAVLRGEAATDLTPASRAHLEAIAHEAMLEKSLPALRDECANRLKQPHASRSIEYLLSAACALNGEVERAYQTLLSLGDHLGAEKQWEALAAIAERALALEETGAAARLLVRAHEGLAKDPDRIEALHRAWMILPDDLDLGLLLSVRYGEAGEGEQRRALLAELLPRFAHEARWPGMEECALEFVEHDDLEGLKRLLQLLPQVAAKGAVAEAKTLLDIAAPPLAKAGQLGVAHDAIRAAIGAVLEKSGAKAVEGWRKAATEAVRQGPGREVPNVEDVITQSGLGDKEKPLAEGLAQFDVIAALAPGRAVYHSSFGAGRVLSNDGENVFIDFAKSRNHRMPYAAAVRSLSGLREDDLRLLRVTDPALLAKMVAGEHATVIVRALVALGGGADAIRLKQFLVGFELVPPKDWTAFWRKAKGAIEKDARVDSSRAFEQHYRIAPEDASGVAGDAPLPALQARKPVKTNLMAVRKFLDQHPTLEKAVAQRFGRYFQRAMLEEEGDPVDRARAGLTVARWYPERADEWLETLQQLWEQGLSVTDLATEDEQIALLEAAHRTGAESDAILSALDSRFPAVRDEANRFRAQLDASGSADLRRTLLRHAPRYPQAALRLIEEELGDHVKRARGGEPAPPTAWELFIASLSLVEEKPKASLAEKVMRWLESGGEFDAAFEGSEISDDTRLKVRVMLRQWRSSDRYFFPAIEAAERLGFAEDVEIVREQRAAKSEKLFAGVGEAVEDVELPVMTRATWEHLQQELERLQYELKNVIPKTIQKARELGDLRENAEYHSAKQKQANVARLVARLQNKLVRAKFVEEMEWQDGVAGVGTEVTLESDAEVTSYWILGEGEHHHGEHVISFQTPVGRALAGKGIGDEVELGEGANRRRYRVVSIERKLPVPASQKSGA